MNPFKSKGFDSVISQGLVLRSAELELDPKTTTIIDGTVFAKSVSSLRPTDAVRSRSTLVVNGALMKGDTHLLAAVDDLYVTGQIECSVLVVDGLLTVKRSARISADIIRYRKLHIEPGAVLQGKLEHIV